MNLAARVPAHTGEPALAARSPARSLEQRRLQFYLAQIVTDIVLLLGSFMLTGLVYRGDPFALSIFLPAQLLLPLYLTIALYNHTYSIEALRNWKSGLLRAATALVIATALLSFFAFLVKINVVFSRLSGQRIDHDRRVCRCARRVRSTGPPHHRTNSAQRAGDRRGRPADRAAAQLSCPGR